MTRFEFDASSCILIGLCSTADSIQSSIGCEPVRYDGHTLGDLRSSIDNAWMGVLPGCGRSRNRGLLLTMNLKQSSSMSVRWKGVTAGHLAMSTSLRAGVSLCSEGYGGCAHFHFVSPLHLNKNSV